MKQPPFSHILVHKVYCKKANKKILQQLGFFFQFRVLTELLVCTTIDEGAECKKMNFRQNFQDLHQVFVFVVEIVGAQSHLERCCPARRLGLDRRFH